MPKRKDVNDDWLQIHADSLDDNFLDVLQQLDFPPLDDDRLNLKLRFFSKSAALVRLLNLIIYVNEDIMIKFLLRQLIRLIIQHRQLQVLH